MPAPPSRLPGRSFRTLWLLRTIVAHRFRMLALLSQPRACLRCLRFPLTFYYHRGNMKRKVHQELCRKNNSYIVTPCLWPKLANPLEHALRKNASTSPLESALANPLDLKFLRMNTCRKWWGSPPQNLDFTFGSIACRSHPVHTPGFSTTALLSPSYTGKQWKPDCCRLPLPGASFVTKGLHTRGRRK